MPKIFRQNAVGKLVAVARNSPFLKHNLVFFLGSLGVATLNYLYYPILGRMLSPVYFGEVQALLALYMQAAIFLTILTYVTVHVTVNSRSDAERNAILLSLERVAVLAGYGLLAVALVFTPQLSSFLNFTETEPFVMLIAALAVNVPLAFRMAFLRGRKLFGKASLTDGIGSFAKLILSPILVLAGWRTFGAITGLAISQVISLWFSVSWARQAGFRGFGLRAGSSIPLNRLKPQLKYALAVFVASSGVVALLSLDIIAVKHYFPPEQAGIYAGMSTVARIVYFLTAPFMGVLMTLVNLRQDERKNLLRLKGSLGLVLALGGAAFVFMALFSGFTVSLLVGAKYIFYAAYLPKLALTMLVLSMANTLLMYQIALRRYAAGLLPVLTLLGAVAWLYFRHGTIGLIVEGVFVLSLALLVGSFATLVLTKKR